MSSFNNLQFHYSPTRVVLIICLCLVTMADAGLSNSLKKIISSDSIVKVWIFFKDKPDRPSGNPVSARAEIRRRRNNFISSSEMDYPVSSSYLKRVQSTGAVLNQVYKWENCASFYITASKLPEIAGLPIVRNVQPVFSSHSRYISPESSLHKTGTVDSLYGLSIDQLNQLNIPAAHDYLKKFRGVKNPGDGVMVAVFDAGFRFDHNCFSYLRKNHSIKAAWDFIDDDSTVYDPDSIYLNPNSRNYQNDQHGSTVLSLISGYDPGSFLGSAWGVDLVLARTENGIFDGEFHFEEDNWFSAIVWAESIGVDIVSSSLAYRTDFLDSTIIYRADDSVFAQDYQYSDLDGKTALVSRAALYAIERGMVIVNAIGNEGSHALGTLSAPADVEKVVSVGAVTSSGHVAYFSSTGPTADGRIKPDLVAPGVSIAIPSVYGGTQSYSSFGQGTSFSTPLVSGVCALIMQSFSGWTADEVRNKLYKYCKLLNGNDTADSYSGRGLPDALLSCMRDGEVYISVKDSNESPVQFALITDQNSDSLGITDKDGVSLVSISGKETPCNLYVNFSGIHQMVTVNSTPSHKELSFVIKTGLTVQLNDRKGSVIPDGVIYYRIPGMQDNFIQKETDSSGRVTLSMYREMPVQIYAVAQGYYKSDTINAQICSGLCSLGVQLQKIPDYSLNVYPNVLRKGKQSVLYIDYIPGADVNDNILISIRAIDGALIWKKAVSTSICERVKIRLENEIDRLAPGFYFLILENQRKAFRRKFLITG